MVAAIVWSIGGPAVTAVESSVYDRWLRTRAPAASPGLVLVVRDAASEGRFGTGSWDRSVLARLVVNVARAGATTVGLDLTLGPPGTSGRGGAAGDALLAEATAMAGTVVYPISLEAVPQPESLPALARPAKAIGHTLAIPDPDGTLRRVPLFVPFGDRSVPAFGLALGAAFLGAAPEHSRSTAA